MELNEALQKVRQAATGAELRTALYDALLVLDGEKLPAVTSADAGKKLTVGDSGQWTVTGSIGSVAKAVIERTIAELNDADGDITAIGAHAFRGCTTITSVTLPACTSIATYAFNGCTSLTDLYLPGSAVCTLGSYALGSSGIAGTSGKIHVPSDLVNTYKSASNWSTYSSKIVAI